MPVSPIPKTTKTNFAKTAASLDAMKISPGVWALVARATPPVQSTDMNFAPRPLANRDTPACTPAPDRGTVQRIQDEQREGGR